MHICIQARGHSTYLSAHDVCEIHLHIDGREKRKSRRKLTKFNSSNWILDFSEISWIVTEQLVWIPFYSRCIRHWASLTGDISNIKAFAKQESQATFFIDFYKISKIQNRGFRRSTKVDQAVYCESREVLKTKDLHIYVCKTAADKYIGLRGI